VFRGHKKEAFSVAWHPIHEDMFASGGSEGNIMYWQVGYVSSLKCLSFKLWFYASNYSLVFKEYENLL